MGAYENDDLYSVYNNLGMNRAASPFLIQKGEWEYILNGEQLKVGVIEKRDGYTAILNVPDASEVLTLIPCNLGTVTKLLMINAAGKLYSADPAVDSTWGTAKITGLSTSARWGYTIMSDSSGNKYMILGNGAVVYKTADGVTFSSVVGAPLGKYWTQLFQRVYCSGVSASPEMIHWSSIGDLTDWSAVAPSDSNSTNIDRYAGGLIKNIRAINDRVVIWKQRAVKRWDGDYLRTVMSSHGLDAPYSIAEVEGMAFTLDREAVRQYDGKYPQEISMKMEDLIYGIDFGSTNVERICGDTYRKRYYLSVGDVTDEDGDTISNCWICYDYTKALWWVFSLADHATAMAKFIDSNGDEKLYFGDTAGKVYEMFSGKTDDGAEIDMLLRSHMIYPAGDISTIELKKMAMSGHFPEGSQVMVTPDYGDPMEIGTYPTFVSTNLMNNLQCRGYKITITHSGEAKPKYYGHTMAYKIITQERVT